MGDIKVFGRPDLGQCAEGDLGARGARAALRPREPRRPLRRPRAIPRYLAMNPNGLVPVLRDGDRSPSGRAMRSCAISRPSTPTACCFRRRPRDRAVVDQWTDWTATRFQPAWIGVFWSVYPHQAGAPGRRRRSRRLRDEAARCFAILDQRLSRRALSRRRDADLCRYRRGDRAVPLDHDGDRSPAARGCRGLASSGSGSGRPSARRSRSTYAELKDTF